MDQNARHMNVPGYVVYEKQARFKIQGKANPFRGQALLVSTNYPSYQVNTDSDHVIHVKVSKFSGPTPWHILAVYYPSGGNFRRARTKVLRMVLAEYKKIIEKNSNASVLIMGDHNMRKVELEKRIRTEASGLAHLPMSGSALTFARPNQPWTDLDHLLASPHSAALITKGKGFETCAG